MKIYAPAADESKVEADSKFVEIWNSFGLGVSIAALLTLIHTSFPAIINIVSVWIVVGVTAGFYWLLIHVLSKEKLTLSSAI